LLLGAALLSAASAVLVVRLEPLISIALILSLPAVVGILLRSWVRLAVVVLGALLVFQSASDELKYGYLILALLCVAMSSLEIAFKPSSAIAIFKPLIAASLALLAYLMVSVIIALSNGVDFTDWFRDVLAYVLLAILPVVGLDASRSLSPRIAESMIGVLGVVGAIGVAIDWLDRRGVSSLDFGRLILSTVALVALAFSLGVTRAGLGPRRIIWTLAVMTIASAMLISGSRTNLLLFIAIIAVVGSSRRARVGGLRMAVTGLVALASTALVIGALGGIVVQDPRFLQSRVDRSVQVLTGSASADLSFLERMTSYKWTWEAFQSHMVWGTGPGYLYPNGAFSLDSATLVLAKWGLVGSAVLLAYLISVMVSIRRSRRYTGPLPIYTAASGWAVVLVALFPFGPWLEDKGFALGMTLLVMAVAANVHARSQGSDRLGGTALGSDAEVGNETVLAHRYWRNGSG
jgi:hypothetical protein